jgi:soluble lytic murein transglycosylase
MRRPAYLAVLFACLVPLSAWAAESGITDDDDDDKTASETPSIEKTTPVAFDRKWLEPFFKSSAEISAAAFFRSGDFVSASKELTRILDGMSKRAPERNPLRYMLAVSLMNQSSWQAAGDIFEELWQSYPLLAPYHALNAGRCRLRRGDSEGAFLWLARVPYGSVPEPDAMMVKVDAFVAAKRWSDVDTQVTAFLARFPKGPRWIDAMFQRAEALSAMGRPAAEVAAAYRKVWSETPIESFATRADERLETLAKSLPPEQAKALTTRSVDEMLSRGMLLFNGNQNAQAEATFAAMLTLNGVDKSTLCRIRYHLAQSVWKQRQRPRAAPLFEQAIADCRAANERDFVARALYQGARSYASSGDKDKAIAFYGQIEKEFPGHRLADDARLRAAELYTDDDKDNQAEKLLGDLADTYPKGDMAPEALWRLAFDNWRVHDLAKASKWLDEILRRYPHEDIWYADGRALYWKARIFEKQRKVKEARQAYEREIREHPLSVYTLFALERMRRAFPEARAQLIHELRKHMGDINHKSPWSFGKQAIYGEPGFLRAVEFARMGLGSEARRELAKIGVRVRASRGDGATTGREDVLWITAILLDRGGQWHASHAVPRYALTSYRRDYPNGGLAEAEWRLAYPKAFPAAVLKNCRANKVPEALQWAIMREESSFYPRAESFANALGLTQMMMRTAARFAKWPVTREALLDPDKNLEVGSKFLAFLLDHYGGAVPLVISGYNAGEGGVDRWLRERGDLELDEFIETIPYDETRGYTKRVLSSYLTYVWLYHSDKPVPSISFTLKKPETSATKSKKASAKAQPSRRAGSKGGKRK